jgi:hypothetical protein
LLITLGWYLFRRWQERQALRWHSADAILLAYGRLQHHARRLGQPTPASQTPAEFETALLTHLAAEPTKTGRLAARLAQLQAAIRPDASRLVALFTARQYGRATPLPATAGTARQSWLRLRPRLWLLRILKKLARS